MATKTRLTPDDLLRVSGEGLHELVNGEIVEMPPPKTRHAFVVGMICGTLFEHVAKTGAGKVLPGGGFILELPYDRDRVYGPDVAFVSTARFPDSFPDGYLSGAPDLAVEVLSPSDEAVYVEQKILDYLTAGARLVWILAPETKTARVYRPDGSARLLRKEEMLEGEDVLPGLVIPLPKIFP